MKEWFGALTGVILIYPVLFQGYVMPEQHQKFETPKIGISAGWLLLFICILVLAFVYVLLRTDARFRKGKRENH